MWELSLCLLLLEMRNWAGWTICLTWCGCLYILTPVSVDFLAPPRHNYFFCNQEAVFDLQVSVGIIKIALMAQASVHSCFSCDVCYRVSESLISC